MATIQQLEKLHHIQRLFHVEDSLEAAVAGERVKLLIEKTEQLIRQRAFLREERRVLRIAAEKLEERKQELKLMRKPNWVAEQLHTLPKRCIQINVGGLVSTNTVMRVFQPHLTFCLATAFLRAELLCLCFSLA